MQGFHCIVDTSTAGFVGLASDFQTYLSDEFPKAPILTFGTEGYSAEIAHTARPPSVHPPTQPRHCINSSLATIILRDTSTLYVPLSAQHMGADYFKYLQPRLESAFHTAALFASAMDTVTLPYRLSTACSHAHMCDLTSHISIRASMNIASLGMALPLPFTPGQSLHRLLGETPELYHLRSGALLSDLTLQYATAKHCARPYSEYVCLRGLQPVLDVKPISAHEQQQLYQQLQSQQSEQQHFRS